MVRKKRTASVPFFAPLNDDAEPGVYVRPLSDRGDPPVYYKDLSAEFEDSFKLAENFHQVWGRWSFWLPVISVTTNEVFWIRAFYINELIKRSHHGVMTGKWIVTKGYYWDLNPVTE